MDTRFMVLTFFVIVSAGCIQQGEVTPEPTTTSTQEPTSTTLKASTTSTSSTSSTTTSSTSTSTTTTTTLDEDSCGYYCSLRGYSSGYCRRSSFECQLVSEIYDRAGSRYCHDLKLDTCCCSNSPDAGNLTVHYKYDRGLINY